MFCPVCKSEYREGYTRCADCDVPLVNLLAAEPESLDHAALARVWEGSDAHENSQVRAGLEEARIPFRVQAAGPNMLSLSNQAAEAIYVPHAMLDAARLAISEAIGEDAESEEGSNEETADEGFVLSQEAETDPPLPDGSGWDPAAWNPEDATAKIWENRAATGSEVVIMSLEENHIHWRANDPDSESDEAITEIFVMPQDEARAREIIREVTEATPPQ
ncbi:MAG TPA: hypothetical protein VFO34_06300 [Candidatus Acidoferrales bacterium]|nr:hypothetical protein [Candidatus Acidoferrales bacterium]